MRAIILAAGCGTRLRPLTSCQPKCMVPLAGVSLLERQLHVLTGSGVMNITLVGGYRAEMLPTPPGVTLVVNAQYESTNMVASLFCAQKIIRESSGDILICYGDIHYEPRILQALLNADFPSIGVVIDLGWKTLWRLRMPDPLADAETLILGANGELLEIGRKPSTYEQVQGQYMGLLRVKHAAIPALLDAWEQVQLLGYNGKKAEQIFMTDFLQFLIDGGWFVQSVPVTHGWLEVDTPDDLHAYESLASSGELSALCRLTPNNFPYCSGEAIGNRRKER